jgi:primosomal protein N' (replication factor Y)
VPLQSKVKRAIILDEVEEPKDFKALEIINILDNFYSKTQLDIAEFISKYYFSSLGEALAIFIPFVKDCSNTPPTLNLKDELPKLSEEQNRAYKQILQKDRSLLFGVTGSGKTEIFISLMADTIKNGKRCIFLMPEISLTPQMKSRLERYFGKRVVIWHSKLTKKQKNKILESIYKGEIDIIAGARSALFTPLKNVGLIIVDEEHDDSYKAMMKPRYHARDMAIYIASKIKAKALLASATPSLCSYYKYDVIKLSKPFISTKKRYFFIEGTTLNNIILKKIEENFKMGQQSLLFVPTRGNFKYLYCQKCGKTHLCPYCSVGMALHSYARHLKCHYCNYTEAIKESCSHCGHTPLTTYRIGTVEAKEIIENSIPNIVIEQFDRDSITTPTKLKNALKRFEEKKSHILLGTQMLSKGHDYADITLSIILGIDYILGVSDYRAREKAMSLLVQIAGRSGRAKSADVIIQSSNGEFFKQYLRDYEEFLKDEMEFMKDFYPPFVSLARVLIAQKDDIKGAKITLDTVKRLQNFKEIEIVGHGKAPIERIANRFRYQILLRCKKRIPLLKALHSIKSPLLEIDIDPVEFS